MSGGRRPAGYRTYKIYHALNFFRSTNKTFTNLFGFCICLSNPRAFPKNMPAFDMALIIN
jgi:hypothetical protein